MTLAVVIKPDYNALAKSLLPFARMQGNVTFCDDDEKLVEFTRRGIALFERFSAITLNPATYRWVLAAGDFCNQAADCPISPIEQWSAKSGDVDVTASYTMALKGVVGIELYSLQGTGQALSVEIKTGYALAEEMPPGIRDIVMRITAQLYEYREVYVPSDVEVQGGWLEQMMAGYWKPRA